METKTYISTIGLEIHAELKTKTKMFCGSKNDPDEKHPNVNVCPICMGHPGTLPTINKEAVRQVLKVGVAVGGTLANFTEFDRKNYFYPDIPKGYQISQYKYPLVSGGEMNGVALTRIHLEEDTARSSHDKGDFSLVDFNRAGLPLMELVTEPVIHSAVDAGNFARELQLLLQYLGVAEANMEKGEMRVEANISVSPDDTFGTKVEVKNLNSFRAVERAIAFEIERHIEALEAGEKIVQETRGWNESKQETYSQRAKEDSHDYRYFPDPDLPKMYIKDMPEFSLDVLKKELPELPWQRRERYLTLKLPLVQAELFVSNSVYGDLFDKALTLIKGASSLVTLTANYITSDLIGISDAGIGGVTPETIVELAKLIKDGKISSRGAKDILIVMYMEGGNPEVIAEAKGLFQQSGTDTLAPIVQDILTKNPEAIAEYKKGKESALQFLIGQGMRATRGSANPQVLKDILLKILK